MPLVKALALVDRRTEFLQLVSEQPDPVVKIISQKLEYTRKKADDKKKIEVAKSLEEKEIQLTWGVDAADLEHKLKKARDELSEGLKVNIIFTKKKGQARMAAEEMEKTLEQVVEKLADVGKEYKDRDLRGGTSVLYLQALSKPAPRTLSPKGSPKERKPSWAARVGNLPPADPPS